MRTRVNYEHYTALAPACLAEWEDCQQASPTETEEETLWTMEKNYCLWPPKSDSDSDNK